MSITLGVLTTREKPLWDDQMKIVLGSRHRDVQKAPFLLDFGRRAGSEIGGNAAVHGVEHENGPPLLPLGGMNRRKNQIVLVEQRHTGLIAGRVWWIEGQFRQ